MGIEHRLLIRARQMIVAWIAEAGEGPSDDERQLIGSIDEHLLEALGAKQMIIAFGEAAPRAADGYTFQPEKARAWQSNARWAIDNMLREHADRLPFYD